VEALVGKEGCDHGHRLQSVIVDELCEWEEVDPVILLIVDVHPKVLLQDLIDMFWFGHLSQDGRLWRGWP